MDEKKKDELLEKKVCQVQARKNYGGTVKVAGGVLPIYTKKQMKSLYPKGGYQVAGEYAPGSFKKAIGTLRNEELTLPLTKFGANSRMVFQRQGFAAVEEGEDRYVAISKKVIFSRAALSALILLVFIAGFLLLGEKIQNVIIPTQASVPAGVPELESGAVDWQGIKVSEPADAPADGIRIPGYKSITIEANKTEVSVNLQNPEKNNCYFVIRLVLLDTGETLYESKMIAPGKGLYSVSLSKALEVGTYNAQLQYDPYDMTTLTRLNGAVINLELIAE